ncbi:MAG: hypothetical protein RIS54_840 [Verrucomicrobiota bacterium]|jgi:mannose-1-phosphate guanylyltransferase
MENRKAYVCIMAGGSGERFWPMSRQATPKHLLKLFSDQTLLEEAVRRLNGVVPQENILVLTNKVQLQDIRAALPFLAPEQIIAEPVRRDNAAAAALATALVRRRDPDAALALLASDAYIKDRATFARQLAKTLVRAAQSKALLTVGVKPNYPATGFGYLEMTDDRGDGFRKVARFVEKPDEATAKEYFERGNYAWNTCMFAWQVSAFVAEAEKNAPELAAFMRDFPANEFDAYLNERFHALPRISVDYAIMEKAASVETLPAEFDWDDVGTWTALPAHMPKDAAGNTLRGPVTVRDSSNNIAVSNGRVIALCGVSDLVVVETADAVLVCHRDAVQDIKKLMPDLPEAVR